MARTFKRFTWLMHRNSGLAPLNFIGLSMFHTFAEALVLSSRTLLFIADSGYVTVDEFRRFIHMVSL